MTQLSDAEGREALSLARRTVEAAVRREPYDRGPLAPVFNERRGVFVTLTENGRAPGMYRPAVPDRGAGRRDRRGRVVGRAPGPAVLAGAAGRAPLLRVEVTVLTMPTPIPGPAEKRADQVEVGRHGLIVRGQGTSGLLLPQVATEYGWTPTEFLDQTCRKAGLRTGCWRTPEVEVSVFEGQIFHE